MHLPYELDRIKNSTMKDFKDGCDFDVFEELTSNHPFVTAPMSLLEQTPLAKFEEEIKELMDKAGFDYKLERITIVATGDVCFECNYCLCWYDEGIHTQTFHFEADF